MRSNLSSVREKVAALRNVLLSPDPESVAECLPGLAFSEVTSDDLQELLRRLTGARLRISAEHDNGVRSGQGIGDNPQVRCLP